MPPKRASTPPSPLKSHRTSRDVPERVAATSPAPNEEDVTPESCDAQLELVQEIAHELRALQATLEDERVKNPKKSGDWEVDDYSEPMIRALMKLRSAQVRALMGLEHLKRETARRNAERDKSRVRVSTVAYELAHLEAEAKAQEKFDKDGEDLFEKYGIELMDEESYVAATTKAKELDARELMLMRLQHELERRKAMVDEQNALKRELETLKKEEEELAKFWDVAKEQMKEAQSACEPLRRKFDLPTTTTTTRLDERVRALTMPLYVLYTQLQYLKETHEDDFTVEVFGRLDDVKSFADRERLRRDDAEDGEVEVKQQGNRRHQNRGRGDRGGRFGKSTRETPSSSVYDEFPLRVQLDIDGCAIEFAHLTRLNVITAVAKKSESVKRQRGAKGAAAIKSDNDDYDSLLADLLFPNDDGAESPNYASAPANADFKFDASCAPSGGRPYKWVQNLCGLSFLPPIPAEVSDSDLRTLASKARARDVVDAVRRRVAQK